MKRSTKWGLYQLAKGRRGCKCSACHADQEGRTVLKKSRTLFSGKVEVEYRCWRCVTSREGALLFARMFPNVLEAYIDSPWCRLRPVQSWQAQLFDSCYDGVNEDDLIDQVLGIGGKKK